MESKKTEKITRKDDSNGHRAGGQAAVGIGADVFFDSTVSQQLRRVMPQRFQPGDHGLEGADRQTTLRHDATQSQVLHATTRVIPARIAISFVAEKPSEPTTQPWAM